VRTKGSGWGGGVILYQLCPICNKKKAYYNPLGMCQSFECTRCKKRFSSQELLRFTYVKQIIKS